MSAAQPLVLFVEELTKVGMEADELIELDDEQ